MLPALLVAAAVALSACSSGSQSTGEAQTENQASSAQAAAGQSAAESRLDIVLERGKLICGVNNQLPGFGYVDSSGNFSGFDTDFCRAIAAALFDDPNAVEFRPLDSAQRFTAVQTGEVDVLIRNTTWTTSRDSSVGMDFAPVIFFDGQGMMVRKDSGIASLADFEGKSICVKSGTTTQQNLADQMRKLGVNFEPVVSKDADGIFSAYDQGRCDGLTTDKSQLASRLQTLQNPDEHVILDVTMSKEPLAPAVKNGDSKWFDVVKWVVYATMEAEEYGVTSENADDLKANSQDPVVKRLLGVEGDLGKGLGVSNDFAYRVIKHVGNYGEIYNRNLGPDTPFNIPRGPNNLYTEGGLIYPIPFR